MSPLDATHAFRSPERLAQLVASIAQGDDTVVEATWVEWKSQWSLTHDKWRRAGAARHMIGFANRDPDRAASFAEGWAYLVLGLEPGNVVGFPIADPADLSAWLRPYVGDSLRWHPEFTQHDGKNILVEVWKYGSSVAMNLQVRDSAGNAYDPPGGVHQSPGVIFPNGKRKPSFTAFRFPFVVRRSHGRLQAWAQGSALGAAYDSAQAPRPLALGDERESRAGERLPGPAAAPQPRVVPSRRRGQEEPSLA